jgi:hypothetical protein
MALTWEVVDTEGDRVIYSKTIGAAAERKGDDTDVIADAGHSAIVQLLADAEFIRAFRSAPPRAVTPPQQPQRGVPRIVGRWQNPLPTPAEIIRIRPVDANIAPAASVLESAMAGVIALSGPAGHGSGFLITRRGFALTNAHVVSDNEPLIARFRGGRELAVRVVRTDQSADIALVEVDCADTCPTVPLGSHEWNCERASACTRYHGDPNGCGPQPGQQRGTPLGSHLRSRHWCCVRQAVGQPLGGVGFCCLNSRCASCSRRTALTRDLSR